MILLALLALGIPLCAMAGLVLGLSARNRLDTLNRRVAALEDELRLGRVQAGQMASAMGQPAPVPP
jgi:hypothetical protein